MNYPLVSVICLCYNHELFIKEALDSVLAQTYPNLEIIIADDASTDNSVALIKEYVRRFPHLKFIHSTQNKGNCKAFNEAFFLSKGEYIVDFATDDVLLPDRIMEQIKCFNQLDDSYGVVYTNALLIDEKSNSLREFYRKSPDGNLYPLPISGMIYEDLVKRFFVSAPTMLIKRMVLEKLGGYNESLAYEDFDFWVRAGRDFKFNFLNKTLTKRRIHINQLSAKAYKKNDKQLSSTVQVCRLALTLNKTESENKALSYRIKFELRHAILTRNFLEAAGLLELLQKLKEDKGVYKLVGLFLKIQKLVNFSPWYKLFPNDPN